MTGLARALGKGIDFLSRVSGTFAGLIMLITAIITCYEIVARRVFNSPTIWTLEVTIFILIWFGFISMACVQREGRHLHVDILVNRLSPRTRTVWDTMTLIITLLFVGIFTYYGYGFFMKAALSGETTIGTFVAPMWVPKLALLLGGTLLGLQLIKDLVVKCNTLRIQPVVKGGGLGDNPVLLVCSFLVVMGVAVWLYYVSPIAGLVVLMLVLLCSGLPIFVALALVGITGMFTLYGGFSALTAIANVSYGALYNFALACLPLFIIAGQLLQSSGAGGELYDLCDKWFGHLPGGLAIATVVACAVFAAISVSSVVVAITIGLVALPALAARGYDKRFSYGLVAAGGTLGIMIPPSGTMIIYSALTEESLGKLFIAGFIPGIVVMALFILYSVVSCSRTGAYTKIQPYSWKERFGAFKTAIWGLLAPAIILFGIYSGLFTVLEAGAVVALYAFVMALARRKITLRQLPEVLRQSAASGGMILAIFFGALVMGLFITLLQVPNTVVQAISAMNIPGWAVIWLLMLIYIILGMFLEVISVMLITLPIVYPLIISLGFDGIWFAVLVTLNMEMALITPPVGMNLYVVKGISGASISDVVRGMIPFFAIMLVGMLIVYFFPQLSTWLPNLVVR